MFNPDIIARKRQACSEQGNEKPQNACRDTSETSGMYRIYPAAQSVCRRGSGIFHHRGDIASITVKTVAVGSPDVSEFARDHTRSPIPHCYLNDIGILRFQLIMNPLPATESGRLSVVSTVSFDGPYMACAPRLASTTFYIFLCAGISRSIFHSTNGIESIAIPIERPGESGKRHRQQHHQCIHASGHMKSSPETFPSVIK